MPDLKRPPPTTRLNKRMAELGLCSRREADDWIARGWVRVNGAGRRHGHAGRARRAHRRRPAGAAASSSSRSPSCCTSRSATSAGRPKTATSRPWCWCRRARTGRATRRALRFAPQQLRGLAPAGRLDIDSTGLLVLTQDGRIARQLIGEDSGMEKEYLVRVAYGNVAARRAGARSRPRTGAVCGMASAWTASR